MRAYQMDSGSAAGCLTDVPADRSAEQGQSDLGEDPSRGPCSRATADAPVLLDARHIKVRYNNGALGVVDVSLQVRVGEVVSLLGANGAGKTTTVRALSGFLRTERSKIVSGDVTFADRDVTGWEPHRIARLGMALVPERRKIFPNLTVREHLTAAARMGSGASADGMAMALELFPALGPRLRHLAGRLSGGQQQMLAIARALSRNPMLMVIDEMTLGLHPSVHPVLFSAIAKIADHGTATLLVDESATRALGVSRYGYFLKAGHISLEGTPPILEASGMTIAGGPDRAVKRRNLSPPHEPDDPEELRAEPGD